MEEIYLDLWFYDLPACWQEEITGITREHYNVGSDAESPDDDICYEFFDNAVAGWWDEQDYDTKLTIYTRENR